MSWCDPSPILIHVNPSQYWKHLVGTSYIKSPSTGTVTLAVVVRGIKMPLPVEMTSNKALAGDVVEVLF